MQNLGRLLYQLTSSNPQRGSGDTGCEMVYLDAKELAHANLAGVGVGQDCIVLEFQLTLDGFQFQLVQRFVTFGQEITATAGRVEEAHVSQPVAIGFQFLILTTSLDGRFNRQTHYPL